MTNKEAIKGLKALSKEFSGYKPNEEMFDMAIKALELVTINSDSNEIKVTNCNYKDTIYRQAAIDAVSDCGICIQRIVDLPSAQPERPKGKWMPHREICREYIGTVLVNVDYDYWLCDTCGYRVKKGQPTYNFCPNCGADMREVSE